MKRRAFLAGLGLAPVAAVAGIAAPVERRAYGTTAGLKGYATGGYIGESGPEAVIPLKPRTDVLQMTVKVDTKKAQEEIRALVNQAIRERVEAGATERDASLDLARQVAAA